MRESRPSYRCKECGIWSWIGMFAGPHHYCMDCWEKFRPDIAYGEKK